MTLNNHEADLQVGDEVPVITQSAVSWVLLLLSALAATTAYVSRTNAVLVRRSLQLAQAQAAADAAVVYTLGNLSDEQISRHGPMDGTARSWQFNGMVVTITVTKEAGRINVNAADDDLIYAFPMSQRIAGTEIGTAMSATTGVPVIGSSNRKHQLQTIDELALIAGWKNQPLECWADALTVYSAPNIRRPQRLKMTRPMPFAAEEIAQRIRIEQVFLPRFSRQIRHIDGPNLLRQRCVGR